VPKGRSHAPEPADLRKFTADLYRLHENSNDTSLVLWPDDRDVLGALQYARRHHRALPPPTFEQRRRAEQARLRLTMIRQIRRLLDEEELAAIDDARGGGDSWGAIALLLGMEYPGSAANRRERLKAATERPDGRRTPEAGRVLAKEALAELERERRAAREVTSRFGKLKEAAEALIAHVDDLAVNDDAEEWLTGAREILEVEQPTPTQQQALSAYIGLAAADIKAHAREKGIEPASTPEAAAALARTDAI